MKYWNLFYRIAMKYYFHSTLNPLKSLTHYWVFGFGVFVSAIFFSRSRHANESWRIILIWICTITMNIIDSWLIISASNCHTLFNSSPIIRLTRKPSQLEIDSISCINPVPTSSTSCLSICSHSSNQKVICRTRSEVSPNPPHDSIKILNSIKCGDLHSILLTNQSCLEPVSLQIFRSPVFSSI